MKLNPLYDSQNSGKISRKYIPRNTTFDVAYKAQKAEKLKMANTEYIRACIHISVPTLNICFVII